MDVIRCRFFIFVVLYFNVANSSREMPVFFATIVGESPSANKFWAISCFSVNRPFCSSYTLREQHKIHPNMTKVCITRQNIRYSKFLHHSH
ncbi:hypothetical protein BGP_5393 [Beggiatoa sp. PS]|nr:hypothetical protein BGP_5393 [Beggiatoa sp. PS]